MARKIDHEMRILKALKTLLHNTVDVDGSPKKPTIIQLKKAIKAVNDYENYKANMIAEIMEGK